MLGIVFDVEVVIGDDVRPSPATVRLSAGPEVAGTTPYSS